MPVVRITRSPVQMPHLINFLIVPLDNVAQLFIKPKVSNPILEEDRALVIPNEITLLLAILVFAIRSVLSVSQVVSSNSESLDIINRRHLLIVILFTLYEFNGYYWNLPL